MLLLPHAEFIAADGIVPVVAGRVQLLHQWAELAHRLIRRRAVDAPPMPAPVAEAEAPSD